MSRAVQLTRKANSTCPAAAPHEVHPVWAEYHSSAASSHPTVVVPSVQSVQADNMRRYSSPVVKVLPGGAQTDRSSNVTVSHSADSAVAHFKVSTNVTAYVLYQ